MKGLTLTVIFDGFSLNYAESIGNFSELKKFTVKGNSYSYLSRQALRYEIYKKLVDIYNIDADKDIPLSKEKEVIQFKSDANIKDYVEADLFGYMKTEKKKGKSKSKDKENSEELEEGKQQNENKTKKRPAPVRISPAVSLLPMAFDVEFGTNLSFAERVGTDPNIFQQENHKSLYTYTITIDLDKVGVDKNDDIELDNSEKAERVNMVLDALMFLDRDIRGRRENLSPLFVIGGLYPIKNPFFLGRIEVGYNRNQDRYSINTEAIESVLKLKIKDNLLKDYTSCGIIEGFWANEDYIKQNLNGKTISDFFEELKSKVNQHYNDVKRET
ncbi:MAG: type I-B CRISPR-associated protein Cas7/Cst2/DevR [Sulfurihydrogenibium sp.]|jgi:CRISPR-associated protein Cst2|nr:type I-B CRISPR-associated protein Cas7/Cst2/DevR [Sulfurihydrogenibium sp.]